MMDLSLIPWGNIFSFIGAFLGWFLWWLLPKIYDEWRLRKREKVEFDKRLFEKIKIKTSFVTNLGYFDGDFLKESTVHPMFRFIDDELENPENIFFDKEWEIMKTNLFSKIKEFSDFVSSGDIDDKWDRQGIPSKWEREQPEKYKRAQKILNILPSQTWEEYKKFLEYGRNRFKI